MVESPSNPLIWGKPKALPPHMGAVLKPVLCSILVFHPKYFKVLNLKELKILIVA